MIVKRFLILLIIALVLVGCSGLAAPKPTPTITPMPTATPTCIVAAADYIEDTNNLLERWDDALAIADSTARISLSGPIADLQEIKREAGDLEYPPCARKAHVAMTIFMDAYIDAYLAFMAQKTLTTINVAFFDAERAYQNYVEAMAELR